MKLKSNPFGITITQAQVTSCGTMGHQASVSAVARKSSRPTPLWLAISIATIGSALLDPTANAGITASWSGTGNWSDATKWSTDPTVPGTIDDIAQLPNTSTGNGTTTLDTSGIIVGTIQNITPNGAGRTWTINASSGNVLTMEVSTGSALINVTSNVSGTLTINPAIVTNSDLIIRATGNDGQTPAININDGLTGTGNVTTDFTGSGNNAGSNISISSLNNVGTLTAQGNKSANGTKTTTIASIGSNVTSVTKSGTSTLVLTGTNSYTGATTISGGTFRVSGSSSSIPTGSLLTLNGGTLEFNRSTAVVQGTDFSGAAITGTAGSFVHSGSGTLTLNAANTYVGTTTATGTGNLIFQNAPGVANATLGRTGTGDVIFDYAFGGTTISVGGLTGSGNLNFIDNIATQATDLIITGNGVSGNHSGVLSGTGFTVTKNGANTQTFSGAAANTYTGLTTVTAGRLALGKSSGINAIAAGGILITGGQLELTENHQIDDAATVQIDTGGAWIKPNNGNKTETIATLILNGGTLGGTGGNNLTVIATTFDLRSGSVLVNQTASTSVLSGSGNLTKTTSGTATLSSANTFSGTATVSDGVLVANVAGVAGTSGPLGKGALVINGGRVESTKASGLLGNSAITVNPTGELRATATTALNTGSGIKIELAGGTIRGYNAATITYGGNVNVTADSSIVNERSGTASATSMTETFGTLDIGANTLNVQSTDNQTGGTSGVTFGTTTLGGNAIFNVTNNPGSTNTTNLTLGTVGETSGPRSLTKSGNGVLTLSGANTYTGNTIISAGTLTLATTGQLKFVPLAGGATNKITGPGTATLNGTFNLDLSGAGSTAQTWTLVDVAHTGSLTAITSTLAQPFTPTSGVWTAPDGAKTWTYTESTGVLALSTGGALNYAAWTASKFTSPADDAISGPTKDPDGDGMNNLLEFLVGTEPKTAEQGKGPVYTTPGNVPTLTLDCSSDALAQVTSVLGKSGTDLVTWPDTMPLFSSTPDSPSAGRTTLVFKDSAPLGGTKRFYRIEIIAP